MAFTPLLALLAANAFALATPTAPEPPSFSREQSAALKAKGLKPDLLNPEVAGNIDGLIEKNRADYDAFRTWDTDPSTLLEANRVDPGALDKQLERMRAFVNPGRLSELERLLESNRRLAARGVSAPLPPGGPDRPAASAPAFSLMSPASLSSPTGLLSSDFKGGLTSARFSAVPAASTSLSLAPPAGVPWWESSYTYYLCKYVPEKCPR